MKKILLTTLLATPIYSAEFDTIAPIDSTYLTHDDVYEYLDEVEESGIEFHNSFNVCIGDDCRLYWNGEYEDIATIQFAKKTKKPKSGTNPIVRAIGKGISGGARVKIKGLKVNADGSYSMDSLEIWAGAGVGADAPIPGHEDGKQVHHN